MARDLLARSPEAVRAASAAVDPVSQSEHLARVAPPAVDRVDRVGEAGEAELVGR